MPKIDHAQYRGWELIRLRSNELEVDVVPSKGGDILQIRWLPLGADLLWTSPWGLRERAAAGTPGDSYVKFMESYPGGWQTLFPNAGATREVGGVEQGFHGEACLAPWDAIEVECGIELRTRLVRSPFELCKRITLDGARVSVEESARNVGDAALDVMWSHHPAFGAALLGGNCRLETAARTFITDAHAPSDLDPGHASPWPHAKGADGGDIDLRDVPDRGAGVARLGYLTELARGWAALTNAGSGLRAELEWDTGIFPHAWLWLEANATEDFPVYKEWYTLAVEPASAFPRGDGSPSTRLVFEPGEERRALVSLTVSTV